MKTKCEYHEQNIYTMLNEKKTKWENNVNLNPLEVNLTAQLKEIIFSKIAITSIRLFSISVKVFIAFHLVCKRDDENFALKHNL